MARSTLQKLYPMQDFGVVPSLHTPLRIQRFEDRLQPLVPFPHKHNFYHLVIVTAGRGWHEIDFHRYPLEKGRVYFMKPAQVHAWVVDKGSRGYVIEFEENILSLHPSFATVLQQVVQTLPDSFVLNTSAFNKVKDDCEVLLAEYVEKPASYEISLTMLLFLLLLNFSRLEKKRQVPFMGNSFAQKFFMLLEENFRSQHEVAFYAKKLNMTAKALTMKLHRLTGKAARTLILERALLESKRLLAYSDLSIEQIAEVLGYTDANYFARYFRSKVRKTPSAFRQQAKKVL